jgi:CheY-like chemotaxis protein
MSPGKLAPGLPSIVTLGNARNPRRVHAASLDQRQRAPEEAHRAAPVLDRGLVVRTTMPTLLIVDDNADVRDVFRVHAENRGLEVVGEAVDGPEGIELAERLDPDAIILDQELPSMTRLAALRVLRRRTPRAVVVMYSSDASIERSALAAGAGGFFVKPDSPREVVTSVVALLEAAPKRQ